MLFVVRILDDEVFNNGFVVAINDIVCSSVGEHCSPYNL